MQNDVKMPEIGKNQPYTVIFFDKNGKEIRTENHGKLEIPDAMYDDIVQSLMPAFRKAVANGEFKPKQNKGA